MARRVPAAGPWPGLSVQSVVVVHLAFRVVSWRMGVRKSKGCPSSVHPSNRKPPRPGFCCGGGRRGCRFSRSFVWACFRRPGRSAPCAKPDHPSFRLIRPERGLRCRASPSAMTGRSGSLSGLTAGKPSAVMAREAGCCSRCRGECPGLLQLREGSDDPPPGEDRSVRPGGRGAQARQQAQQDDHHRRHATQTGNQMHETKTPSPIHQAEQAPPANRSPASQRQPRTTPQEPKTEASRLPDNHSFSPYHPVHRRHTSPVQPPGDNEPD